MQLTSLMRRECVLAAQCEAGLTRKMIKYRIPTTNSVRLRRKIAKTLRFYRRFYRPQNWYR